MNTTRQYPYSIIIDGKLIPANTPITDIAAPVNPVNITDNKGVGENADNRASTRNRTRTKAN